MYEKRVPPVKGNPMVRNSFILFFIYIIFHFEIAAQNLHFASDVDIHATLFAAKDNINASCVHNDMVALLHFARKQLFRKRVFHFALNGTF